MSKVKVEVSKKQFLAYESVRRSGVTNMFMVTTVSELSGLAKETCIAIMEQYSKLAKKYLKK